jgi:hypothetical protein
MEYGERRQKKPQTEREGEVTSEKSEESAVYSMKLPKISHAEIQMQSSPKWFLPMFTSRMKRHSQPTATASVPVNLLSLSFSLFSSRATSRQLSLSTDASTSHDLRWGRHGSFQFERIA